MLSIRSSESKTKLNKSQKLMGNWLYLMHNRLFPPLIDYKVIVNMYSLTLFSSSHIFLSYYIPSCPLYGTFFFALIIIKWHQRGFVTLLALHQVLMSQATSLIKANRVSTPGTSSTDIFSNLSTLTMFLYKVLFLHKCLWTKLQDSISNK